MRLFQKINKFINPKGFNLITFKELNIQLTNIITKVEIVDSHVVDIMFENKSIVRISGSDLQYYLSQETDRN